MNPDHRIGRRRFLQLLQTGLIATCFLPATRAVSSSSSKIVPKNSTPIPPGAGSLQEFRKSCTACQLCVSQCPSGVLRPAFFENGITGFMQPVLRYGIHHFCDYECIKCIEICPTKALGTLSLAEKKLTRIGKVKLIIEECIVIKDNKACGACAEHCPTGALRMVPYKPGITKPEIVNKEACIGCGGCESICPVRKLAVYIERLELHERAEKPKIVKQEKVQIDGFGF